MFKVSHHEQKVKAAFNFELPSGSVFVFHFIFTLQPTPVTDFLPFFFFKDSSYIERLEVFQIEPFDTFVILFMLFPLALLKRISTYP